MRCERLMFLIALAGLCGVASAETYLPGEGDVAVRVYQTTARHGFREIPATPFTVHAYTNRVPLDVDAAEVRGKFRGLGVAMTDSACWVLSKMPSAKRRELLEAVFSPTRGAGLRGVRLCIGASDYATALYTLNDVPDDVEMKHFSVARDDHWVFPMVREALSVNPDLFIFAAPWSPPGWMKTTGNFVDGHFKDGCEQALANYLCAYAKALRDRGLTLGAVTINNESCLSTNGTYPACVFSAEQEARVAVRLAAALKASGLATQVWAWDFNYGGADVRIPRQLEDAAFRAAVSGLAFHSYSPMTEGMRKLKAKYSDLPFYHTEMGPALHVTNRTERFWCDKLSEAFENGCEAYTSWNLCLTEDGQPLVGPHLCAGLMIVDPETGDFKPSAQYALFRHVGPFVRPGAEVLRVAGDRDGLGLMLFRNPDGEHVLVVVSQGKGKPGRPYSPRPKLYVKFAGEMAQLPLPYGVPSVTTMVFGRRAKTAAQPWRWRGFLLDEARHFFGKEKVKEFIDLMAKKGMNVFHWHLTDDQGWRVDLPGMKELVRHGATRAESPKRGTNDVGDGVPYGPYFYTADDIREIVRYAADRGIDVMPEFDVPGHVRALLASHPEFACVPREELRRPGVKWGIEEDVLCIGNTQAVRYVEKVIDGLCELFPFGYFHIGGDECPKKCWQKCPKCKDLTQAAFTRQVVGYLASKGRTAVAWDEVLSDATLPKSTVIQCWHDCSVAVKAAQAGHPVIVSRLEETYLSIPPGEANDPWPYRKWVLDAKMRITVDGIRSFDPMKDIPESLRDRILGGECCAWTEEMATAEELDYKVRKRLEAFGEALSPGKNML